MTMKIDEAKDWMKLKSSDLCPKGYPEKWHEAKGFIEGYESRQIDMDAQELMIETLEKQVDELKKKIEYWQHQSFDTQLINIEESK